MYRHGVFRAVCRLVPHRLVNLADAEYPAGVFREKLEDAVLDRSHGHLLSVYGYQLLPVIHSEAP